MARLAVQGRYIVIKYGSKCLFLNQILLSHNYFLSYDMIPWTTSRGTTIIANQRFNEKIGKGREKEKLKILKTCFYFQLSIELILALI